MSFSVLQVRCFVTITLRDWLNIDESLRLPTCVDFWRYIETRHLIDILLKPITQKPKIGLVRRFTVIKIDEKGHSMGPIDI